MVEDSVIFRTFKRVGSGTSRTPRSQPYVLRSCIESTEQIIRADVGDSNANVLMQFGNGSTLSVSNDDDIHMLVSNDFGNYDFLRMPGIGHGIGFIKKTSAEGDDKGEFRMHFGAIVRVNDDGTRDISNMMETGALKDVELETLTIRRVEDFFNLSLGQSGCNRDDFLVAIVYAIHHGPN